MTGLARQAIPTGLLGDEGKSKDTTSLGTAALWQEGSSGPILRDSLRFYASDDQSRMPRRTRCHPCVDDTTICAHFHRYLMETKHPTIAMLCTMLIFLFRCHMLLSSDVIDERAVSQYASPFSSFMLTICYDTFRFCTHRRVLICCPIILHALSYFLSFSFYPIYACNPHYRNRQFTTARVPLSV